MKRKWPKWESIFNCFESCWSIQIALPSKYNRQYLWKSSISTFVGRCTYHRYRSIKYNNLFLFYQIDSNLSNTHSSFLSEKRNECGENRRNSTPFLNLQKKFRNFYCHPNWIRFRFCANKRLRTIARKLPGASFSETIRMGQSRQISKFYSLQKRFFTLFKLVGRFALFSI